MITATYKASLKSLLRSVTFWLVTGIYCFMIASGVIGEFRADSVLDEWNYAQYISNLLCARVLIYPLSFFTVTISTLLLTRDYSDKFFEIEKAGGMRPLHYLAGRVLAVLTAAFALEMITSFVCLYARVIICGGLSDRSWWWFFADSAVRLAVSNILLAIPNILFYTGLVFFLGTLFKNALVGAGGGFLHIVAYYIVMLRMRFIPEWQNYFNYFSPVPEKVRYFCWFTNIEGGDEFLQMPRYHSTVGLTLLCIGWLTGISLLFFLVSWLRLRQREI